MFELPTPVVIPLATDAHGAIRVRDTRVLLDVIIVAFQAGATPEDIAQQFPSVALPDVYLIIAHYLTHAAEIDSLPVPTSGRSGRAATRARDALQSGRDSRAPARSSTRRALTMRSPPLSHRRSAVTRPSGTS
jgi:uncharacterized protein (DUF433 family)